MQKKLWIGIAGFGLIVIGITVIKCVILLNLHPLSYYYTLDGMKTASILGMIEVAILIRPTMWFVKRSEEIMKQVRNEVISQVIEEEKS